MHEQPKSDSCCLLANRYNSSLGFFLLSATNPFWAYVVTTITATWPSAGVAVSSESRMLDERLDQLLFSSSNK